VVHCLSFEVLEGHYHLLVVRTFSRLAQRPSCLLRKAFLPGAEPHRHGLMMCQQANLHDDELFSPFDIALSHKGKAAHGTLRQVLKVT